MNFSEFEPAGYKAWHNKASLELNGKSFEETLKWSINNDVQFEAYADQYLATSDELEVIQSAQKKAINFKFVNHADVARKSMTATILANNKSASDDTINEISECLFAVNDLLKQETQHPSDSEIIIEVALQNNYLLTVAKLRALRFLIARLKTSHESSRSITIKGKTDDKQYETDNEHVNIVRAATMSMAGIVGGCDYIEVVPFDKKQNEFSSRIAKNIIRILNEEAYLNEVGDPAAGSYFIENLTYELINFAWERFVAEAMKG